MHFYKPTGLLGREHANLYNRVIIATTRSCLSGGHFPPSDGSVPWRVYTVRGGSIARAWYSLGRTRPISVHGPHTRKRSRNQSPVLPSTAMLHRVRSGPCDRDEIVPGMTTMLHCARKECSKAAHVYMMKATENAAGLATL